MLCGDTFYNDSGNIISPGYPDNYKDNEYCEWEIIVSEGRAVDILFNEAEVEYSKACSFDYIEVFYLFIINCRDIVFTCISCKTLMIN